MPSKIVVRGAWAVAAIALLIVALVVVLPFVASTQIVRNRIAQEISDWSGYRVVLRGAPRINVWPNFHAVLGNVEFQEWGKPESPPVLRAEQISIDLSAIAALSGNVSFSRLSVLRPVLRVKAEGEALPLPAAPGGGRMIRAIETVRRLVEANNGQTPSSAVPSDPLGTIEFREGRILIVGNDGERELVSSLGGKASWPALNRAGSVSARGIWRGESVGLELSADQPLTLFAGSTTRVTAALDASPLRFSFDGKVTPSGTGFVDGTASLSSPSLRRLLEWSETQIPPGAAVGTASIAGRVIGDKQRLKIENTQLSLGGHPGNGILEFSFGGKVPSIGGTLAFDSFDLHSFLSAFMRLPGEESQWSDPMDLEFSEQIAIDLRLSAAKATAGPVTLSQVAATAQIKDGLVAFDVSDASAFGGTIQAGFHVEHRDDGDRSEVRFLANDVEMRALSGLAGLARIEPQGKGSVSVLLEGPVGSWESLVQEAQGSITLKLGNGQIGGLDPAAFLDRTRSVGFFPLGDVPGGTLPVTAAEVKLGIRDGLARLEVARIQTPRNLVELGGVVSYVSGGLALSGQVSAKDAAADARPIAFFVGGSWEEPFVSPILSAQPGE